MKTEETRLVLLNLSLDEVLAELKSLHEVWGEDEYDPEKSDDLLWAICYQIASVMSEDHCCLIEQAAKAVADARRNTPDASEDWKGWGDEMRDRVLNSIYRN